MQLLASEVGADYYPHGPGMVSHVMLTITYLQAMTLYIHRQGRFNNHAAHSLYKIMVLASSVMGVMKMGNIVPRAGVEPTCLVFWASVLPLQYIGSLMSPLYTYLSMWLLATEVSADLNSTL